MALLGRYLWGAICSILLIALIVLIRVNYGPAMFSARERHVYEYSQRASHRVGPGEQGEGHRGTGADVTGLNVAASNVIAHDRTIKDYRHAR